MDYIHEVLRPSTIDTADLVHNYSGRPETLASSPKLGELTGLGRKRAGALQTADKSASGCLDDLNLDHSHPGLTLRWKADFQKELAGKIDYDEFISDTLVYHKPLGRVSSTSSLFRALVGVLAGPDS